MLSFDLFKSWTFWGSLFALVSHVAAPNTLAGQIATAAGTLVGIIGARNAVAKASTAATDAVNNVAAVTTQTAAASTTAIKSSMADVANQVAAVSVPQSRQ